MAYEPISWATDETDAAGDPTKVTPTVEVMRTGLLRNEPMGRQWFNYLLWYILTMLDQGLVPAADSRGDVKMFTKEQPDMVASGAWRLIKTEQLTDPVETTIYYYEHTGIEG